MQFDITGKILNYKGKPVQDGGAQPLLAKDGKPQVDKEGQVVKPGLTWATIIHRATHAELKGGVPMTSEKKERAFKITARAYSIPQKLPMSADDVKFLLEQIGKFYPPLILGRAKELFGEPKKE